MKYISFFCVFLLLGCGTIVDDTVDRSEEYGDTLEQSIQDARSVMDQVNKNQEKIQQDVFEVSK